MATYFCLPVPQTSHSNRRMGRTVRLPIFLVSQTLMLWLPR